MRQFLKSWTKKCIFEIKIKIASTNIMPNICYGTLFRVEFREQPFWSFGKKLPPEYLVLIRKCGSKYCWKGQFKGFTVVKIQFIWSLFDHYLIIINFAGSGISASSNYKNFTCILFSIIWISKRSYLKHGLYDNT